MPDWTWKSHGTLVRKRSECLAILSFIEEACSRCRGGRMHDTRLQTLRGYNWPGVEWCQKESQSVICLWIPGKRWAEKQEATTEDSSWCRLCGDGCFDTVIVGLLWVETVTSVYDMKSLGFYDNYQTGSYVGRLFSASSSWVLASAERVARRAALTRQRFLWRWPHLSPDVSLIWPRTWDWCYGSRWYQHW